MAAIWIVEDDDRIRLLVEAVVRKAGDTPSGFNDAEELERALQKGTPDLLLLDLMLRRKDGFAILEEWKNRRETRAIPVMILSARSAEGDKVRGLEMGADDYITKPFGVRELQARIRAALRRSGTGNAELRVGPLCLRPDVRELTVDGRQVELTAREYELLTYLARHAGETISRAQLIRDVWGYANGEDPSRTVDFHIKMVRLKLGDRDLIQTVRGLGYRLDAGDNA